MSHMADSATRLGKLATRMVDLWIAILVIATLVFAAGCGIPTRATQDAFDIPVQGQHIYDPAHMLTASQITALEARAADVEQAGAPAVVYLRQLDTAPDETVRDARSLMSAWDVESSPGARDGVVMFLNVTPSSPASGQVTLSAGEKHHDGGSLPEQELQRILDDVVMPNLWNGDIAGGIDAGLGAIAQSLTYGPPPPRAVERVSGVLARVPFTAAALAFALLVAFLSWGMRHRRRTPSMLPTTTPPDTLAPAIAGALVAGRITSTQMDATVLDMARHGALSIEPDGARYVQIHLLQHRAVQGEIEEAVWETLSRVAYGGPVVPGHDMQKLRMRWEYAQQTLRDYLVAMGWYDPTAARNRRILSITAGVGFVLLLAGAVASIIAGEPWGILGSAILLIAATFALIRGYSMPETTAKGEAAAAPWRGYLAGLKAAPYEHDMALDLDIAVPYAVAFGVGDLLNDQLRHASQKGYAPAWFGQATSEIWGARGFFPYWIAFHAVTTTSMSSASNETSAAAG